MRRRRPGGTGLQQSIGRGTRARLSSVLIFLVGQLLQQLAEALRHRLVGDLVIEGTKLAADGRLHCRIAGLSDVLCHRRGHVCLVCLGLPFFIVFCHPSLPCCRVSTRPQLGFWRPRASLRQEPVLATSPANVSRLGWFHSMPNVCRGSPISQ